jgi:hypothetical protein
MRSMIYTDTNIHDLKQKIAYHCYNRLLGVTCLEVYDKKNPFIYLFYAFLLNLIQCFPPVTFS